MNFEKKMLSECKITIIAARSVEINPKEMM